MKVTIERLKFVVAIRLGALWRMMGQRRTECPVSAPLKISISATCNPCCVFGVEGSTAVDLVVVKWASLIAGAEALHLATYWGVVAFGDSITVRMEYFTVPLIWTAFPF